MKIRILESAKEDLREGFDFYESQERGVGSYFLECLFSDIESLRACEKITSQIAPSTVRPEVSKGERGRVLRYLSTNDPSQKM